MQVETALQIGRQIGQVETLAKSAHIRVDDLWRALAMHSAKDGRGRRGSLPWDKIIRYLPMAVVGATSLLGIVWPEPVAKLIAAMAGMGR